MGYRYSEAEDEILRAIYPDYAGILKALPHRSYGSLGNRCGLLRIRRTRHIWTSQQVAAVKRHYPVAPFEELEVLVGVELSRVQRKGRRFGIKRAKRPLRITGIPLLDQLRLHCREIGYTLAELDALADTGTFFKRSKWRPDEETNQRFLRNFPPIAKGVHAIGGVLKVVWNDG